MNRLTRDQITKLFSAGRLIRTAHFNCRAGAGRENLSVAVVVPKTVSNKATRRNRLRRQVKGALQHLARQYHHTGQLAVVVKKSFDLPFKELTLELSQCFKR